ncbi:isoprenyl transferase [Parvibaculum sp.]|uniref:isoprenyl transferase n=1 Tax=Parvibaculum sp. TaxID=2024848 RepID=UPI000C6AAD65|nr:isoprenyl transferase [Parvibaculum sp.]HAC58704.1 isoprenyl transferase [Rhodobiaceae bacterium]MAU60682.1 di-trans,poly-cis-decaprenylcistransferase [Parvibaculum sp.]MBO6667557.1 isoprenyl transferase [Parvibaculum sp.]MBO6692119.1 isoprenyl transferase [Parvibaculum sp.]MBO6714109.1 isoprenyl transferase [Parvibaculum sp.]
MTLSSGQTMSDAAPGRPPRHVAIIMDGNGRWAAKRHLPRAAGHRQGVEAVRVIVRAAGELGIEYLTLYGFSSENWKRPADEVNDLMGLLRLYIRRDLAELHQNGVRIRIIGERDHLEADIVALIEEAEALTRNNARLQLVIAFNYGGQNEIASAVRKIAREVKAGRIEPDEITPDTVARFLDTAGVPDPDLIIRTSGEKRLSNFLIWQSAYSELVFSEALWPDFTPDRLREAIAEYDRRERRFGGRSASGA